jgi:serine/threonine-protein kinase
MKVLAPRLQTPTKRQTGGPPTPLPQQFVVDQVQRLRLFATIAASLWTVGLVMDQLIYPYTIGTVAPRSALVIEILGITVSGITGLYVRYGRCTVETKGDVGLWYMLFNAALIAALNTYAIDPTPDRMGRLSWITIVVLISSMVMPASPRKMLAATLAAASMDPFGVWLAHLRGVDTPSLLQTLANYVPNYSCAVVATLPAHMFRHMGRQLREAQELGSYQLVELLGQGGMGEVWRARHRMLARDAAVKLVRPEVLGASDQAEARILLSRFEREAQATAALNSPNSIRLFDFGMTDEGTFYYVMELLNGRDLESLVRDFGPLPAERAIYLLRQVCHSLAEAHARGLVHRDIKPANIYVCRAGLDYDVIKVLDFGLVKVNKRDANETMLTSDQTTTGTPAYMAPEIILGQSDVDRRADVYALGCVAYFLVTGQLVFQGNTSMQILVQHVQSEPVPPSQRSELPIPPQLDELILSCLAKDPNKRPQDASELFEMTMGCTTCNGWSREGARAWWETHLPELAGPLVFVGDAADTARPMQTA